MGGKYRVPYEFLGLHFDDPFDTKSPGFRRTVHALDEDDSMGDEDWLVRLRPAVRAARRSALLVCTMRDDSVAGVRAAAQGVPETDRSEARDSSNDKAHLHEWGVALRCDVFGAPGRNRSTDTRICKTGVLQATTMYRRLFLCSVSKFAHVQSLARQARHQLSVACLVDLGRARKDSKGTRVSLR